MKYLEIIFLCSYFCSLSYQIHNNTISGHILISTTEALQRQNHSSVLHNSKENSSYSNQLTDRFSKWSSWSSWSTCKKCFQKRVKICLKSSCDFTKVYQERICEKKRCKRRRRQQQDFHVVMPEKGVSTKIRHSSIWGSWTPWSMCSQSCRTFRRRYCRTPGRCKQKRQVQNAYCYRGETKCELFVFNLMQMNDHYVERQAYSYDNTLQERRKEKWSFHKKCGMQYKKSRMLKIIGGSESPRYKWPWHVALINQYAEVFCGGTLIAPEWVLTASHCVRSVLIVRLNEHDLRYTDGRELELLVHKVFQHPDFNQRTVNGDIALLKLPMPVKTPVACLPNKRPTPRQLCSVMGWGKTKTNARQGVSRLREAQIPVVEQEICKWAYNDLLITDNMVCAGWTSGKSDTCAGDSGGGLLCPQRRSNRGRTVYSVEGITSFGKGCGKKE